MSVVLTFQYGRNRQAFHAFRFIIKLVYNTLIIFSLLSLPKGEPKRHIPSIFRFSILLDSELQK